VNDSERTLAIRRILVALDASTNSLAALNAAAELAASMRAELIGLFVEDEDLLSLAGLPFAQEIHSHSGRSEPIDSERMEQELQLQAYQARRALEAAAEKVDARWSFKVVRGQVTPSVLAAALDVDLLAMGRASRPYIRKGRLGSTARAASVESKQSVLFMPQSGELDYPVLVTFDGTEAARQALAAAARLAQSSGDRLNVILLADSRGDRETMEDEVTEWLEERGLAAAFHWLPKATVDNIAKMVQAAESCVLVLGGEIPLLEASAIQELLDETDCPVMLVR
jgi:nucleotide-binding universal stress UspA family protein